MGARRKRARRSALSDWRRWFNREAIGAALRHHRACLGGSLRRLAQRPLNTLMTVGVVAIALAMPSGLFVAVKNLQGLSGGWSALGDLTVYLEAGTSAERAREIAEVSSALEGVQEARLISPQKAREELEQAGGFSNALDALEDNPLPWALVLRTESTQASLLERLAGDLAHRESVAVVQYDRAWLDRLRALLDLGRRGLWLIAGLLAAAVVLVVGNTIRLDIENRRREIDVMRLLGASDGFVRRPFLYSGLWYGLLGGVLAVLVVAAATAFLGGPVAELARAYNSSFRLDAIGVAGSVQLALAGAAIGFAGSWIAVGRQLARPTAG